MIIPVVDLFKAAHELWPSWDVVTRIDMLARQFPATGKVADAVLSIGVPAVGTVIARHYIARKTVAVPKVKKARRPHRRSRGNLFPAV